MVAIRVALNSNSMATLVIWQRQQSPKLKKKMILTNAREIVFHCLREATKGSELSNALEN